MYLKKCLALLVSAALAVSLLASCGSRALSSVMADLLTGLYDNVSVEVDNDLTAALKKAVSAGGTQEEILDALIENLNLSGVSIAFSSLGSGQQGQHGVTLTFQTGTDPDAAARIALAQWASVFGSLPKNGSYSASVAMIEAENGYYIAVDVEVTKAGSHDKDDSDDDEDDEDDGDDGDDGDDDEDDGNGYTKTVENGTTTYTVTTGQGLKAVAAKVNALQDTSSIVIKLQNDITLTATDNWTPIGTASTPYTGTFDGDGHSITGLTVSSNDNYVGLIGYLDGGTVTGCTVSGSVSGSSNVGGVVGSNDGGTVTGCTVSGDVTGTGDYVGGVVGWNDGGTVTGCTVSGDVTGNNDYVGGVVGWNDGGTVTGCTVSGDVTGNNDYVGGVVGINYSTVTACYSTGSVSGGTSVGGVVGANAGTVTACYSTGSVEGGSDVGGVVGFNATGSTVTACYHATSSVSGNSNVGGVVGINYSTVTACYWGSNGQTQGIGYNQGGTDGTTQVDGGTVTWSIALISMNQALQSAGSKWRYELGANGLPPVLTQQP